MNLVDLLLALVVALSVWLGWRRGLLSAGADLIALAGSLVFAFLAYPYAVMWAGEQGVERSVWLPPLAFVLAYTVMRLILGAVFGHLARRVSRRTHANPVNRAFGVVPGAANGVINATIVAMLLMALPISDGVTRATSESVLAARFAAPAEWLEAKLKPIFDPAFDRTLNRLTVAPDSRKTVTLPFKVENARPRPDLEYTMLELLNQERRAQGLRPLKPDPEATEVAREHSQDMFERGYFSHLTPEGEGPFDRMREGNMRFIVAGENLAFARTVPMAHQGLMKSPGHRENILRPYFGRVGIGIVDGGRHGLMVTQNFRN